MLIDYNYKTYLSGITFSGITYSFTPPFKNNKGFIYSPAITENYTDADVSGGIAFLQNEVEFDVDNGAVGGYYNSGSVIDYYAQFMPIATPLRINNLRIGLFNTDAPISIFMPIRYKRMIFSLGPNQVEPVTWLDTIKLFTLY
jgi:hypothetical protein